MNSQRLDIEVSARLDRLRQVMADMKSVIVAYSGGVDSAVVLAVAHEQLHKRALACIGVSPSYPQRELQQAQALAEQLGAACRIVNTAEHLDERYSANPANRCFFCKNRLYDALRRIADAQGFSAIANGAHADDVHDHVHGLAAARDWAVRSPLLELGFGKRAVREMARVLKLPVWDKPAMACLASRVPHGIPITQALLGHIEAAEDAIAALGFTQFRVRHHNDLARIELPPTDLARAVELRQQLLDAVQRAGYRYVTLDLAGFRPEPDLSG